MGEALGDLLPIAAAIAVFPVPVIAAVVIVGSEHGRAKGVAFVLAWCAGLAGIGTAVLLFSGAADGADDGEPATWLSVTLLVLGVVLLAAAGRQWRGRPRGGEEAPLPAWMRAIDRLTTVKAAAAGLALTALNPKNVLLAAAAAAEIAATGISPGEQAVTLAVFVLLASVGVGTPLVLSLAPGERSRALLEALRGWMTRHSAAIMTVLLLLIGAKLIGDAISGLSA